MASYHLSLHPNVSRGKGQSLVRTAAYNSRAQFTDERTGEVWDYRYKGGLLAEGIMVNNKAPDWARDLGQLVNEVERVEKRSDSQLAMNLDIALPHEQTLEQNRRLLTDFVREQFMRQGYAAHYAIHEPDRDGDDRNIHAHVLVTLRKIDANGFAATKTEQQDRYRNRSDYTEKLRDSWEKLANRHLERNGIEARIDRRSLKEQGLEREPQQHKGPSTTGIDRRVVKLEAEERSLTAQIIDLAAERDRRDERKAPAAVDLAEPPTLPAAPEKTAPPPVIEGDAFFAAITETPKTGEILPSLAESEKELTKRFFAAISEGKEADRQAWQTEAVTRTEENHANREVREVVGKAEGAVEALIENLADTGALSKLADALSNIVTSVLGGIFSFFAGGPPKLTAQQQHDAAQARGNVETIHARDYTAKVDAREAEFEEHIHAVKTGQQQEDLKSSARRGTPPTREANMHERDDDYGHEREP